MTAWRYGIAAVLLLSTVGGGAYCGPDLLRKYIREHLSVTWSNVELRRGSGLWPEVDLVLRIHNSSGMYVSLESANLTCSFGETSIVTLEGPSTAPGPLAIPSGAADTELRLRMKPHWLGLAGVNKLGGSWKATCRGPITVALWKGRVSHDVEIKTESSLSRVYP